MLLRLLKFHEHNKIMLPPGSKLTVSDRIGQWLIEQGVAETWLVTEQSMPSLVAERAVPAQATRAQVPRRRSCCGWKW